MALSSLSAEVYLSFCPAHILGFVFYGNQEKRWEGRQVFVDARVLP